MSIEQILKDGFDNIDDIVYRAHSKLDDIYFEVHHSLISLSFKISNDIACFYKDLFFWVDDFRVDLHSNFGMATPFKLARINPPKDIPSVYFFNNGECIHSFDSHMCRSPINQFIPWS